MVRVVLNSLSLSLSPQAAPSTPTAVLLWNSYQVSERTVRVTAVVGAPSGH